LGKIKNKNIMNSKLINIEYIEPNGTVESWKPDGAIKVSTDNLSIAFSKEELPLIFSVINNNNEEVWKCELNSFCWGIYYEICYKTIKIKTNNGIELDEWKWDVFQHGDICHQIFHIWSLKNKGTKGIAIGTHDGTDGEWVGPVSSGILDSVLVEPSDKQFSILKSIYSNMVNVNIEKLVITPTGGEVEFFEVGNGKTNSVNKEHTIKYDENLTSVKYNSITLRNLVDKYNIGNENWWLHLDVENLDDKLLLTFDYSNIQLPCCLIFEHEGLSNERTNDIQNWLNEKGYICSKSARNTICLLNN
jgi:hypothetical protein